MLKTIWIGLVILSLTTNAFAQDLVVKAISEDFKYATLRDRATGNEVTVEKGQQFEGLRVVEIGRSKVVLGSVEPDGTILLRQFNMIHHVHPEIEKP